MPETSKRASPLPYTQLGSAALEAPPEKKELQQQNLYTCVSIPMILPSLEQSSTTV